MNYINRLRELDDKAIARYLDKTDFNPSDWLEKRESLEYEYLMALEQGDMDNEIYYKELLDKYDKDNIIKQ